MKTEIIDSIDNINNIVIESEIKVINALIDSYTKAIMIMENCSEDIDVYSYNIIQEMFVMEATGTSSTEVKKENIFKKAWEALKSLIDRLKKAISDSYRKIRDKVCKDNGSLIYLNNADVEILESNIKKIYEGIATNDLDFSSLFDDCYNSAKICCQAISSISNEVFIATSKSNNVSGYSIGDIRKLTNEVIGNGRYSIDNSLSKLTDYFERYLAKNAPDGNLPNETTVLNKFHTLTTAIADVNRAFDPLVDSMIGHLNKN